jgi:hypothetical protein
MSSASRATSAWSVPSPTNSLLHLSVNHIGARFEPHAHRLQPLDDRLDHCVVLIEARPQDPLEALEPWKQVHEVPEIATELSGRMPGLEGKGAAPHEPKRRSKKARLEAFVDPASRQRTFRAHE